MAEHLGLQYWNPFSGKWEDTTVSEQEEYSLNDGVEADGEVEMVGIPADDFAIGITLLSEGKVEFAMKIPEDGRWLYAWADVERAVQIRDHLDKLINNLTS